MKAIIVLTLLAFLISLYPDSDLAQGHMRRPVRHPAGPVSRGGSRWDLQWRPRPSWQRVIMLEAGRRDKRRPIDFGALIQVALKDARTEDCNTICDTSHIKEILPAGTQPVLEKICQACGRVCTDRCCPAGQVPTDCPTRAVDFADSTTEIFNTHVILVDDSVDASCMENCVAVKNTCVRILSGCEGCPNCCQAVNSGFDECRPKRP